MTAERNHNQQQNRSSRTRKSFVLRCWQEDDPDQNGGLAWRFSIKEVGEHPREHHFRTAGQLLEFFDAEVGGKFGENRELNNQ